MKTNLALAVLALHFLGLLTGCASHRGGSADRPADADYSRESCRQVRDADELVCILDNGMVVIARRLPSPAVTVRAYVRAGSAYEGRWLGGGLSHLLEHLVAGGTTQRRSEAENRNLLQQIGNNSNAYTTVDHTCYFVNTTPENLDKAVDLVAGWVLGAKITPEEFAREHQVVQRELEKNLGESDWVFHHLVNSNRYRVSPAGVPVIGYQAVIQGLSREDVYEYYRLAYQPNNMVFVIAGDVEPQQALAAVQRHVKHAAPGRLFDRRIADEPPTISPRTVVGTFPGLGSAKVDLSFPSMRLDHPDLYALDLLATILGQGPGSLLVQRIVDEKQLATSLAAWNYTPDFVEGQFTVRLEAAPAKVPQAIEQVLLVLESIARQGIAQDRIDRAKAQLRAARAFGMQTAEDVAESLAGDYLSTGDTRFTERYLQRIAQVSAEELKRVAGTYLQRWRLLTTVLLPAEAAEVPGLTTRPTTRSATRPATDVQRYVLEDGTVLLLKRLAASPVVEVKLFSLGGLTEEDAESNGLGNLAMQAAIRGTASRSARQIAEFFDSIGGRIEASCGNNTWSWSASCLRDDFPAALEVFADVVRNPAFPEDQLNLVRQRTLAAIEAQNADWFGQTMRFFRSSYFGPSGSPYQFLPIGTARNVEGFTVQQVRQWYTHRISSRPRVLAIYGDIDIDRAKALAARHFGPVSGRPAVRSRSGPAAMVLGRVEGPPSVEVQRVELNKTDNPQAGVMIGFNSRSVVGDPQTYAMAVADTLLSGYTYPTGYVFETLRGQGLVYDAQAFVMPGRSPEYPGTFVVYAVCDPANVNKVIDLMLLNIARLQGSDQDIGPDWFARAKGLIVTSDALEHETAAQQAQSAALDELLGLGYDHHSTFADNIRAVGIAQVRGVARLLLRQCVVTVTTPLPQAVSVPKGVRTYEKFPPVELAPAGTMHATPGPRR